MGGLITKNNVSKSLQTNELLSGNVPETKIYSESMLKTMLNKYSMVYVKPNRGTGGKGIFRVEKLGAGSYKYQINTMTKTFESFDSMAKSINIKTKSEKYAIQHGIHLMKHKNRLFDLRIMVQKNPNGKWETTGVIGRLGHPKKIVTNVCKGGSSKPIEVLLKDHVTNIPEYKKWLENLGYRAAKQLNKTFPRIKELGLDVGIDCKLHPWILEANPQPAIYGFKTLKDKSIYQKICRYQKAYGRQ
ncbi:hypothetical protein PC41400_11250 [Paenibacillus chitinolyticus]|uniref:YheC/YheD family protein n=1 Tax=Paenibacillus chitinolyticus TaxID=79263 RepID=A0A410WUX6_9BACL|nr:YheC/YheD family protein [Paenibacillus chitinolyticus]MCY9589473.1 YheC/YheD family protein [Paenibacillus chitinolyticus]MCY9599249.1 YheC/YheD family protein [Paenibacillus chitinolyticus]QAV18209.1 hypothetical protein PC41400_11250 [Paenibacillus chitinolyticus]